MTKAYISPYLVFSGQCEEALNFYQSILGGKIELTRFGDMPMPGGVTDGNKIMHATLQNEELSFMASDAMGSDATTGTNVQLSIAGTDDAKLSGFFAGLAEGGTIDYPLAVAPWGDKFGMLTDKYGFKWMVNIGKEDTA